jgi:hypothetical protein
LTAYRASSARSKCGRFSAVPRIRVTAGILGCCALFLLISGMPSAALIPTGAAASQAATGKASTPHVITHRKRHRKPVKVVEQPSTTPTPPPQPVPPAEQAPSPPNININAGTLQINANNSSLIDILSDVSKRTGMVVEGSNHDERIYGQYGPGPVSKTLSQLLDGAGYNYVIVDGRGPGSLPAKLLLTTPSSMPATSAPAPVTTTYVSPSAAPANPSEPVQPKSPQEIFQELRRMHPPQ